MIYNWTVLKENCPIPISDLCSIGWDLQVDLQRAKRNANKNDAFYMKTKLNRIIKIFLGIVSGENGKEKEDKQVEVEFREAYSRILASIDKKEDEIKSGRTADLVSLPLYISEIESVLIGDVYDPVRIASEAYPKDKKMFILKAFEIVNRSALVFGGEARFKPAKSKIRDMSGFETTSSSIMSAEEIASNKGKAMMRSKFDANFPDFEGGK